jgi:hypothetical protein
VRASILFALQIKARDAPENLQPRVRVAADFGLRLRRTERIEGLIEKVPHHARLGHIASGAHIAHRQVIVDAQVALDEAGHLPIVGSTVVVLEDENVTAAGGAGVALAVALVVGVRQRGADRCAQRRCVRRLGSSDAIRQTSFFHGAPCRTAYAASGARDKRETSLGKGAPNVKSR